MTGAEQSESLPSESPVGEPAAAPTLLTVELTGDRAMVEHVILEVRALAQKTGLQIPDITVTREPRIAPKRAIPDSDPVGDAEQAH